MENLNSMINGNHDAIDEMHESVNTMINGLTDGVDNEIISQTSEIKGGENDHTIASLMSLVLSNIKDEFSVLEEIRQRAKFANEVASDIEGHLDYKTNNPIRFDSLDGLTLAREYSTYTAM